jgi:rod shape determining protein RodA
MRKQTSIFQHVDWLTIGLYLILMTIGWISIYAASYNEEHKSILDLSHNYGKQLLWIGTSLLLAILILMMDARFFEAFAWLIYLFFILLLLATLFLSPEVKGTHAWIEIGMFKLQPSEFAKFATSLALAKYLGQLEIRIEKPITKIISLIIILLPASIIILQNDMGSALVFASFIFVLYREGLSPTVLIVGFFAVLLLVLALMIQPIILLQIIAGISMLTLLLMRKTRKNILTILILGAVSASLVMSVSLIYEHVLKPHQQQRIDVLLGKQTDPKGAGYNVNQSIIAIGSGGLTGKGFLQGTLTKFDFVPEQSTDFIFCTIGEEWGFMGSSLLLLLFLALFYRLLHIAERQKSAFNRIYAYGVASVLFFHVMVNIGMTIGLLPVIGIPLPFISYGGSSLWAFTILLFILIRLDRHRLFVLR